MMDFLRHKLLEPISTWVRRQSLRVVRKEVDLSYEIDKMFTDGMKREIVECLHSRWDAYCYGEDGEYLESKDNDRLNMLDLLCGGPNRYLVGMLPEGSTYFGVLEVFDARYEDLPLFLGEVGERKIISVFATNLLSIGPHKFRK